MTHGEIKVLVSSLKAITESLKKVDGTVPIEVYIELHAMEKFLLDSMHSSTQILKK